MKHLFQKLLARIDPSKVKASVKAKDIVSSNKDLLQDSDPGSEITHTWLWPTVGNFLRPKDIIVTETGLKFNCTALTIRNFEFWYQRC
jgi:pyruvate decarboxylase